MSTKDINQKISDYVNGKMSDEQAAAFLRLAENDPFLSDAIDGYKQTNANPEDLSTIKNRIIKPYKRRYLNMIVGLSVAASLILVAFYMAKDMSSGLQYQSEGAKSAQIFDIPIFLPQDSVESVDSVFIVEDDMRSYTAEIRIVPQEFDVPESIAPLHTIRKITVENNIPENELNQTYKYRSNHYYSYIGSFKIVDYRYDKRQNHDNLQIVDNSTTFTANRSVLVPETQTTYMDFLQSALDKYQNADYSNAVFDFNIILEQYPTDANAIFYKALCYFELDENDKALNLFETAISLRVNTFHEESMWYSGMIYKEEKQYAAAEQVLQEIVNDNGYYGVQAKKELDELYKIYLNE